MKTVKNIFLWVLSAFLLLMAAALFTERFVSGLCMLTAALLCNPLVLGVIAKSGRKLKKRISIPGVIILFFAAVLTSPAAAQEETESAAAETGVPEQDGLTVHFLDVGQGDATLIACGGEYMLIDAGDNSKGTAIQNYLTKQGVSKLKYVIGTHPDADHIGGLDVVLYKFDCETVMMPDIANDTATYRDVIDTMEEKGYENTLPEPGDSYSLGGAEFTIVSPGREYEDTNNSSVVVLLTHGVNRFLFMGDAEEEAETDILQGKVPVETDVLKVGHHGSRTASSLAFLQAAEPEYAVISCGEDNSYGHPHAETLNNLRAMGVQVFRTDEQGTVVAVSDGEKLTWNCAPSETWKAGENTRSADTDGNPSAGSQQADKPTDVQSTAQKASDQTDTQDGTTAQSGSKEADAGTVQASSDESITGVSVQADAQNSTTAQSGEQIAGAGTGDAGNSVTGEAPAGANYIGNRRNGKLHRASCHTLPKAENQVIFSTREEAVAAGYDDPCGNCNP